MPYDGSPSTLIAAFSLDNPWAPGNPITVGSDVLFWAAHEDRAREHVYHGATGASEPLLDVDGVDVFGVGTDGKTLVWLQSSPPGTVSTTPTKVDLWSSTLNRSRS